MKRSVKVSVANQQFTLKTDATARYVKNLASYVDDKLAEAKKSGRTATTQSLALLAAMNIADELFELREQHDALKREVRERSQRIMKVLDAAAS